MPPPPLRDAPQCGHRVAAAVTRGGENTSVANARTSPGLPPMPNMTAAKSYASFPGSLAK